MTPRPLETRLLVTVQRPGMWLAALAVIVLLVLTSVWMSYEYGRSVAGYDATQFEQQMSEIQMQLELANAEIAESQHQAAMLERNSKIDGDASVELKASLNEAQSQVLELKKELAFYKSIVTPEQTKRAVAIQTIQLEADGEGGYKYRIMVSQRGRNDRFVRGTLNVSLKGSQDGVAKVIALKNVSKQAKKTLKFGFKYFQNFEGRLKLPATFQPENMRVQVKPSSKRIDVVDETFAWTDLTAGGKQNVGQ
jgi:hypothetical protein